MNRLKLLQGKKLLAEIGIQSRMNPEILFGSGTGNRSENPYNLNYFYNINSYYLQ